MKPIYKELWRNFRIPLAISLAWASFNIYTDNAGENVLASFIKNFSTAFFLTSWGLGQFKRVQKQIDDKGEFEKLSKVLTDLVQKLESQTMQLIGYTLGDSKHFNIFTGADKKNPNIASFSFENPGKFPAYDVRVHWVNLDAFRASEDFLSWKFSEKVIPAIKPNELEMDVLKFDMEKTPYRHIFIYVTWRNGSFAVEYEISNTGGAITFQRLKRDDRSN